MYKCEMCEAVSETEMKCAACNVDMKEVEEIPEVVSEEATPEEPQAEEPTA